MSKTIETCRGTIHYEDRGRGPILLCVHGFPLDHSMWREQLELADVYRVILPDLPGFGASPSTRTIARMSDFADDLAAFLDSLEITTPLTYCGLSMGGYVGWEFWARYPDRVSSFILADTRAANDSAEAARARELMAARVLQEGTAPLVESMLPKLFGPEASTSAPDRVAATKSVMAQSSPAGAAAALRGMAERRDFRGELPTIQVPALLICGDHDVITPPAEMQTVADSMPEARLVLIPNAGHMAPLEDPARVNAAIREFGQHR